MSTASSAGRVALQRHAHEVGHCRKPSSSSQKALPDALDARIALLLHAARVGVDPHRFVQQPLLENRLLGVRPIESADQRRLVLFAAADVGERQPPVAIDARQHALHALCIGLDAIHQE